MKSLSIRELQNANLCAIEQIWDEISSCFEQISAEDLDDTSRTLKQLFSYLSDRSQAVSFLISYEYAWDAEIVLRCFYETSIKILYICFAPEVEKPNLINEFWVDFEGINDRRTAQKAEFAQNVFAKGEVSHEVFAALRDENLFKVGAGAPKHKRRALEQKWSFVEIVKQLSAYRNNGKSLKDIQSFLHIYGMSSHLIHADKNALDLMRDRKSRDPNERKILEQCHIARILSDQVHILWFCSNALKEYLNYEKKTSDETIKLIQNFSKINDPFQTLFAESQKEFYERWRSTASGDKAPT